jgi:DNA-cytosine methyltransferase
LNNKLKVLDLFSGIGGFSLGLHSTGIFDTVKFVEFDKFCQKVLQKNFPGIPIEGDIRNVKGQEFEADVITGGFPCQPFSVAGKQKGTNDNRYLWPEMFRLIKEIKPEFVIGENVQGLINLQDGMVLRQVQDQLEGEGFEVQCFIIPASGIGAWHQRNRVWIVAHSKHNGYLAAESRSNAEKNSNERKNREEINPTRKFSRASTNRYSDKRHERSGETSSIKETIISNSDKFRLERDNETKEASSRRWTETTIESNSKDVSNTTIRRWQECKSKSKEKNDISETRANVSNTISELSDGCSSTTRDSGEEFIRLECKEGWHWNQVRSEVKRCSEQGKSTNQTWWQIESNLCGVPNGISYGLDKGRANRIKSLGNAIVPQCARILGLAIKKVLKEDDRS